MKNLVLLTVALTFSGIVYSQRSSNDNAVYWSVWQYKAKEGKTQDFMEAAAEKTAKFNGTAENAMSTYRISTGPNTGTFVRITGPDKAADFDMDRSAEGEYWRENVSKYVGQDLGLQRWVNLEDGSMNFSPGEGEPAKYFEQTFYIVKPDKVRHFRMFNARVVENMKKRNMNGQRGLFRLITGGNTNLFSVVYFFDSYKQEQQPENENRWEDDYNELFGPGSWDEDIANFRASYESWSVERQTLQLIPEMTTGMMK